MEERLDVWKTEYEMRLAEDVAEGRLELPREGDRRKAPRLKMKAGKHVLVESGDSAAPLLDISTGGMSFYSEHNYFVGEDVTVQVANAVSVHVIVVNCEMEPVDEIFMEFRYRVRARFAPGVNGYKIYVMAHDIYFYNLEQVFDLALAN